MSVVTGLCLAASLLAASASPAHAGSLRDSMEVLRAVGLSIVGSQEGMPIVSEKQAETLAGLDREYHGFEISGLNISDRRILVGGDGNTEFDGFLSLENAVRRSALVRVKASYSRNGTALRLAHFEAWTVSTGLPRVDLFFIPMANAEAVRNTSTLSDMLMALTRNDETAARALPRDTQYRVYAAVRERLSPGAVLWVSVDEQPEGNGRLAENTQNYNFADWRVASNDFTLNRKTGPERFIKVFLKPGTDKPESARVTRLIYVASTKFASAVGGDGLLSMSNAANARAVQQRLKDLGFLDGPVDGVWGPGSRAALRRFKSTNGLEETAIWDKATQDMLFPRD